MATATPVRHHQNEIIEVTRQGWTFKASRRSVQHFDWTVARLKRRYPWAKLVIEQPCDSHFPLSVGTHDYDAVFDFKITGITWRMGLRFLKNAGWMGWWRHYGPWAAKADWHFHMISMPPGLYYGMDEKSAAERFSRIGIKVGEFVDGGWTTTDPHQIIASSQVFDGCHKALGLKGEHNSGDDSSSYYPPDLAKVTYLYRPFQDVKRVA